MMIELPSTMRAAIRTDYGGPETLQVKEIPLPNVGPKDVLVKVAHSTVNRTDCGGLRGEPKIYRLFVGFPKPRNQTTGTDFAGTVVSIGDQVSNFRVGDRVFGFDDNGLPTHAQYVAVSSSKPIRKIPDGVSDEVAIGSIEGAHYAINFINKLKLTDGMKVMVFGATGAIGSAAIQLLKDRSIHVVAVCHSSHVDRVHSLGPDQVIAFDQEDFTKSGDGFDAVFDAVGKSSFSACKPLLKAKGTYVSSELGPGNENLYLPLLTSIKGGKQVVFPFPSDIPGTLEKMADMLEREAFHPLIDRHYPLAAISEAFEYVESGQKLGNVILHFD